MKRTRAFLLVAATLSAAVGARGQEARSTPQPEQALTVASALDRQLSAAEKLVTEAADAMPEDRFNFSPESLNIPGSSYKGVRTFALQVRHIAASNNAIFAPLTGETLPANFKGGNGPEDVKTKAEILRFLKDSFALGHRAVATLDDAEHVAAAGGQQVVPPGAGDVCRRPRVRSLRTDGGVPADERDRAAREPG